MACITGKAGALSVDGGTSNIAQLTTWTITQTAETIQAGYMGNDWMCTKSGLLSWEGSAEALFDTTEVYPTIGSTVNIIAYEEGTTTTYSGSAILTSIETSAAVDDMITVSLSFAGDGTLTTA